ncbi:glycosyltransferase family 2 protein [Halanaerobium congolense]|uniref:Rhamnosyltransferase n=1 Tax=Halanaerobium congolense TaxID=54121 RepID=A0A4R7DZY3_9FIRM|nr:glycosyltransferase family 2 protein [Halanaerobium congolense]TDS28049.1 rhamnosyltransferase [Halanaerobium congolense]SDH60340.1 rhamnosyltransferase [Halanaerobium congolense]
MNQNKISKNKISAGITLFEPNISLLEKNINLILPQIEKLILVDNGSKNIDLIKNKWGNHKKIDLICNKKNLGVAKALNQQCERALERQYDWIITLDQDTLCPENIIDNLSNYLDVKDVAIVCPEISYKNYKITDEQGTNSFEFVENCITSGSLTSLKVWEEVNGFNEWLFIDYVDFDFCIRLRINGYKILKSNNIVIQQNLGEIKTHKILGLFEIDTYNHSPFRNYYYSRNIVFYVKKYRDYINPYKELFKLLRWESKKILLEDNKLKIIKSFFKGLIDGIKAEFNHYII